MFMCRRFLQVAALCGLLLAIRDVRGSATTAIPSADKTCVSGGSSIHVVSLDPAELVFDHSSSGTLDFSAQIIDTDTDTSGLVELSVVPSRHTLLEQASALTIESTNTGDFVVPIPALGIGWTLLIGAAMYRVGVRVLRVRT